MSKSEILVGYEAEVAEEARLPVFHTIITGITQAGKTEELKRLVTEAQSLDYTVLILDVKDKPEGQKRDFEGFGVDVPIYLAGIADTLSIYGLLESHSGLPLRRELPELARACKRGKKLRRAYEILKELLDQEKIHPVRKDRVEILVLVLEGLIAEMDKAKPSSKLRLKKGKINVMNLTGWSSGFKQLAVNDAVAYIRKHYRNIIIAFDEAHQQIPQGYGSGSKRTVISAIKEGAGSQQYLWCADQTIKEIDKDVIAQIPLKIYGGQPGAKLRAKETVDHLPVKTWRDQKINEEFIMRLKTGFFIVGERDQSRLVYALPIWMPPPLGRLVAQGKCSPETAKDICQSLTAKAILRVTAPDLSWKKRYDVLFEQAKKTAIGQGRFIEELQEKLNTAYETVKKLEGRVEDLKYLEEWKAEYGGKFQENEEKIKKLEEKNERLRKEKDTLYEASKGVDEEYKKSVKDLTTRHKEAVELISELKDKLKHFEYFEEALRGILEPYMVKLFKVARETGPKQDIPSEISVTAEQPILHVKRERTPLTLHQKDLQGRIAIVYAEGLLPVKAFTTRQLNKIMEQRFGRKEAFANFKKVLTHFVSWGFFEKVKSGRRWDYRIRLNVEKAKEKGLLVIEE